MLHVPLTLDVSSQMDGTCIIMTGTLAQSYFLLPNIWVCKPCPILQYASYEASPFIKKINWKRAVLYTFII